MAKRVERPFQVELPDFGVWVFESAHTAGFVMQDASWPFHKIALVAGGAGVLHLEEGEISLPERSLVFVPSGIRHRFSDHPERPMTLLMACFDQQAGVGNAAIGAVLSKFLHCYSSRFFHGLMDRFRYSEVRSSMKAMIFEQSVRKEGYQALVLYELFRLLVFLTRLHSQLDTGERTRGLSERAFESSMAFLEANFHRGIGVQELADIAGLSYRRYTEHFKRRKGKTVNHYLTQLKVDFARERLVESRNILYAALESGFEDLSHFYRVFKKSTGMTPKRYLKSLQKEG